MCIVIDTNCFSPVFNPTNLDHPSFEPVLHWIVSGRGKVVYGGTKYLIELKRATRYLRIFGELKKAGKVVELAQGDVDTHQQRVEKLVDPKKHNDPHLPAIVCASRCRLVCTKDDRSHRLLKEATCYPKGVAKPKIYKSLKQAALLIDQNIADVCKPTATLNRAQRATLSLA
jgi:hypothetical protein